MQWNQDEYAGFTSGTPWLKVNPNYTEINVDSALQDPNSIFFYYQKLIHLRKENRGFVYGDCELLLPDDENVFAYTRSFNGKQYLVVLNFFGKEIEFVLPESITSKNKELLFSNYAHDKGYPMGMTLRPYEANIFEVK